MMTEREYTIYTFKQMLIVLAFFLGLCALFIVPDYIRSKEYTEYAKCFISQREENYFLGKPISFDYCINFDLDGQPVKTWVRHNISDFPIGTYTTVYFTPNHLHFRLSNGWY